MTFPLIPLQKQMQLVWVTFQKEAIHKYPAALTDPNLADVSFLGYPHRHMLHFKVAIQVLHDNRDVEFIQFKRWLESLYQGTLDLDYKSMEMISDELAAMISNKYPERYLQINVSEDGENGAETMYITEESPGE